MIYPVDSTIQRLNNWDQVYMLWFNFILGLHFIFFCFNLTVIHYYTQKQKKRKFKPRIKLNHNIYINSVQLWSQGMTQTVWTKNFQVTTLYEGHLMAWGNWEKEEDVRLVCEVMEKVFKPKDRKRKMSWSYCSYVFEPIIRLGQLLI